ncbi:MAG TPA: hypothetical protein ENJ04_02195 [Nitrospirae bacterium]|nr:hypothetical protein [Nitrospirota bacterium]
MSALTWIRNLLSRRAVEGGVLSLEEQLAAWRKASERMDWEISREEFQRLGPPPSLTDADVAEGFHAVCLFYGFGDDGSGHSDAVLSGKRAWLYACRRRRGRVWQSPYIDFDRPDAFRLRPSAPPRPKGFYFASIRTGAGFQAATVASIRGNFDSFTGWGPEGLQFLCITHPHFSDLMSERKTPFLALADYDVAPYGFNDFFDVPILFCSNGTLGLGIGNADRNYPGFDIPILRL